MTSSYRSIDGSDSKEKNGGEILATTENNEEKLTPK
jgi:hypothetical protein